MSRRSPDSGKSSSRVMIASDSERPPSYSDGPDGFTQTTSVTQTLLTLTTTTTTTTSFFSRLKKRSDTVGAKSDAANSSTTVAYLRPRAASHESLSTNQLRINKDLPALPEHAKGAPSMIENRSRPVVPTLPERRDSVVAASFPFALANASLGLPAPLPHKWSTESREDIMDPVERQAITPTPRLRQIAGQEHKRRFSLTLALTGTPSSASSHDVYASASLENTASASSVWLPHSADTSHSKPKKSKALQNIAGQANQKPEKQITRRASWWGRKKAERPISPTQSSLGPNKLPVLPPVTSAPSLQSQFPRRGNSLSSFSLLSPQKSGDLSNPSNTAVLDISHSPPYDTQLTPQTGIFSPQTAEISANTPRDSRTSLSSLGSVRAQSPLEMASAPPPPAPRVSSRRPRALSLFLKPNSSHSLDSTSSKKSPLAPSSNGVFPRPKTAQESPLLRRLSSSLLTHSPYPSSPVTNSAVSVGDASGRRASHAIPRPNVDEETPAGYVERLIEAVSKPEISAVLASSGDEFHTKALKHYIEQFTFENDPLDIAVRRLLMDVALPRETQQIDRVMEAFATRYTQCNPDLFTQPDQAYILAFSLIMLHTDAFNKSNKHKMTKAGYVKNTRLPGVQPEVLEYFFDNIVFAPFIFIEDPVDVNGQRGFTVDSATSNSSFMSKSNKIDPYYLISQNLLCQLRVAVEEFIPPVSPYHCQGTVENWDYEESRRAFAMADVIELGDRDTAKRQAALNSLALSGFTSTAPSVFPLTFSTHAGVSPAAFNDIWTLKLTKIGLVNRKEDSLEGGKKVTGRKWRQFKVALTGSQLLFFKDLRWDHQLSARPANAIKPDELISVNDAVALFDASYTKYRNTFRLALPNGRQYLIQAFNEHDLNEWLARINYASAFKTAGLRMRTTRLSGKDVELTGIAAANSHVRDAMFLKQKLSSGDSPSHKWVSPDSSGHADTSMDDDDDDSVLVPPSPAIRPPRSGQIPVSRSTIRLDVESAQPEAHEGAEQLQAAFEDVKAELAAGSPLISGSSNGIASPKVLQRFMKSSSTDRLSSREGSSHEAASPKERLSSRATAIQLKVSELETKIATSQAQLDADLRHARNLAILASFQQATRNRIQAHVHPLAKRINQLRIDIAKLRCHRAILHGDFVAEERQKYQMIRAALKVANATLKRHMAESSMFVLPPPLEVPPSSPSSSAPGSSIRKEGISPQKVSIVSEHEKSNDQPNTPSIPSSRPSEDQSGQGPGVNPEHIQSTVEHVETVSNTSVPEEAEDWNKTRAAKRVSLVTIPADALRLLAVRSQLDDKLDSLQET